eukprot:UN04917
MLFRRFSGEDVVFLCVVVGYCIFLTKLRYFFNHGTTYTKYTIFVGIINFVF